MVREMTAATCASSKYILMHCHSIRDFFLAIVIISTVSMTILYEISLPWIRQSEKDQDVKSSYKKHVRSERDCDKPEQAHIKQSTSGLRHQFNSSDILAKVKEIERLLLGAEGKRRSQTVVVHGTNQVILDQELPVYEPVLKKYGFVVQVPRWYRRHSSTIGNKSSKNISDQSASMLLLMDDENSTSLQPAQIYHQKNNQIPELLEALVPESNLCQTIRLAKYHNVFDTDVLSHECFNLADHKGKLSQGSQDDTDWWKFHNVKNQSDQSSETTSTSWQKRENIVNLAQSESSDHAFVQRVVKNHLLISNHQFIMKLFVLVTSLRPLRAYRHTQTIVQFYNTDHNTPVQRWTGDELNDYLYEKYSPEIVTSLFNNLHTSINQLLLISDFLTQSKNRCSGCFQLLEVDVSFNNTFHAFILSVKKQPRLEPLGSWSAYVVKQKVIEDMLTMITRQISVAEDIFKLMTALNLNYWYNDMDCKGSQQTCLTESEILYLLESRRESLFLGGFIKIYPSKVGNDFLPLLQRLSSLNKDHPISDKILSNRPMELHSLLVNMERFYASLVAEEADTSYDDLNIPLTNEDFLNGSKKSFSGFTKDQMRSECSKDKTRMPYLSTINFYPALKTSPPFQAVTSDYLAEVDYKTYLIQVWAVAESCYCEARMEEKYGIARPTNVTLGIGDNKITIFVVDLSHGEPWVINTYSVVIYRRGPTEDLPPFDPAQAHQVCTIKQDCSLKFSPKEPCGLQNAPNFSTWINFTDLITTLPACYNGDEPGEWYVPCDQCGSNALCYWKNARWQPDTCSHGDLARDLLPKCFNKKKILFVGDSTTRGMFHYMAEGVNRTLTEWDKTHNLKIYQDLNNGRTLLGFAYYPQFWLQETERPVFEDALNQLMKRTSPLSNTTDTVLVVGGVHWLSTHHINVIREKLNKYGLTGIQVIIKGLGSGFHQPVQGVHCLSEAEHQKLLHRNQLVTQYARDQNYHILETFNMTMSRYTDFLQGKCACHFHRVSPAHHGERPVIRSRKPHGALVNPNGRVHHDQSQQYHVEGDINAVYSEILINMICKQKQYILKR